MKLLKMLPLLLLFLTGCNKFLNILPADIATLDQAFQLRATAEKYLFTCYSYLPHLADANSNYTFLG
ncbi:MAG: RagB/SusD family nutrient uptake outer membrane protein, partial [Arachidicoccus sp.]